MHDRFKVVHCDVAVVGGGIAGVSIAERLAREARRQGKRINVILFEKESCLAGGATGKLENWYHAGGLYSKLPETRFFFNCLSALEDMYNWYHFDAQFARRANCNFQRLDLEQTRPRFHLSDSEPRTAKPWFTDEILYLLPKRVADSTDSHAARYDDPDWTRTRNRVMWLVHQAFHQKSWLNDAKFAWCQSLHEHADVSTEKDPNSQKTANALRHLANEVIDRRCGCKPDYDEWIDFSRALSLNVLGQKHADYLWSGDAVMNANQIVRDLAEAAFRNGVQFYPDCTLKQDSVQVPPYGPADRINGLLLEQRKDPDDRIPSSSVHVEEVHAETLHVRAHQYVFALGAGYDVNFIYEQLRIPVRVKRVLSVIAVVKPALSKLSFAVMNHHQWNDFNHIYQDREGGYSFLADSSSLAEDASDAERTSALDRLLEKAEAYFGRALRGSRDIRAYFCVKTEFIHDEKAQRDYSYTFRPNLDDWDDKVWKPARQINQRRTQELIRNLVMENTRKNAVPLGVLQSILGGGGSPDPTPVNLGENCWALKKAIHFALLQWVATQNNEEAKETFEHYQKLAVEVYGQRHPRQPNYVCVVPGKFSFFPTLAYQVYEELEARGVFTSLVEGKSTSNGSPPGVFPHHADQLLKPVPERTS